jgi:site-specific recombinase XerD
MLPNLQVLEKVGNKIQNIPNQHGEYKRREHYCCYLLCQKAGLRVSEAVNFNLNQKTHKGLYFIKTKGKKKRLVYIPKRVISELKKCEWRPKQTNRFNFYHFLKNFKENQTRTKY